MPVFDGLGVYELRVWLWRDKAQIRVHVGGERKSVASFPDPFKKLEKMAWYSCIYCLHIHSITRHSMLPPCAVILATCIFNSTLFTMAICV